MVISDVQNVLLKVDDGDVEELAQVGWLCSYLITWFLYYRWREHWSVLVAAASIVEGQGTHIVRLRYISVPLLGCSARLLPIVAISCHEECQAQRPTHGANGSYRAMDRDQTPSPSLRHTHNFRVAQITIICLRILIGYAKSTGRTLALLLAPTQARAVQDTDGSGDNGAGPRLAGRQDQFWQNAFLPEVGVAGGSAEDNRVLPWGPLSPWLLQEAQRFAAESKERPLKAAAIAAAVLPFSGAVLFFGTPVVAGDAVLQWGASTSVGRTVAQGTQNAVEVRKRGEGDRTP